jgi:hypothetical protein
LSLSLAFCYSQSFCPLPTVLLANEASSWIVGNSEVMGENGAHDSASKSASDREQAPIGRSSSDVHEGCHFAN